MPNSGRRQIQRHRFRTLPFLSKAPGLISRRIIFEQRHQFSMPPPPEKNNALGRYLACPRRLRARRFRQPKKGAHHKGHPIFSRRATPSGGLLDLSRWIFENRQSVFGLQPRIAAPRAAPRMIAESYSFAHQLAIQARSTGVRARELIQQADHGCTPDRMRDDRAFVVNRSEIKLTEVCRCLHLEDVVIPAS